MTKPTTLSVNDLMNLAADNDSSAINVLDMIDNDEAGARTASDEQYAVWYNATANE